LWLAVAIAGHEDVGASIDYDYIAGPDRGHPRPDDFPVGAEFEAVILNHSNGPGHPRWYYLAIPEAPPSAAPDARHGGR
jgi:hypothetical protein